MGATWTVELRPVHHSVTGPVVNWICSGVPTEFPVPETETVDVLAGRGLLLFPEPPAEPAPRTRSRWLIGYVTGDSEVLRLALMLAELVDDELPHPMVLAARWIEAGYSPDTAVGWVTAGISSPAAARTLLTTELTPSDPLRVVPRGLVAVTRGSDQS